MRQFLSQRVVNSAQGLQVIAPQLAREPAERIPDAGRSTSSGASSSQGHREERAPRDSMDPGARAPSVSSTASS